VLERTITVNGCSKTYAMTGWRIGYCAAPKPLADAMSNLQDQVTSNPNSFAQYGAVAALQMPPNDVEAMRKEFEARRNIIVSGLQQIPGVEITSPSGAFYVLPKFTGIYSSPELEGDGDEDDHAFARYLLRNHKVAAIPGSVFEAKGHLRLTYATSRTDIERGVARIAEAVKHLRR
jgi:aspartate aminotransferase